MTNQIKSRGTTSEEKTMIDDWLSKNKPKINNFDFRDAESNKSFLGRSKSYQSAHCGVMIGNSSTLLSHNTTHNLANIIINPHFIGIISPDGTKIYKEIVKRNKSGSMLIRYKSELNKVYTDKKLESLLRSQNGL